MANVEKDQHGNLCLTDSWYIEDIKDIGYEIGFKLTRDEAEEIMRRAHKYYDSTEGLNTEILEVHIFDLMREKGVEPQDLEENEE